MLCSAHLTSAVTTVKSFDDVETWRREFVQQARIPDGADFPFVVVGNKIDCASVVPERRVAEYCLAHGSMSHILASAKDGRGVDTVFQTIATAIFDRSTEEVAVEFAPLNLHTRLSHRLLSSRTHSSSSSLSLSTRWLPEQTQLSVDLNAKREAPPSEGCC